MPTTHDISDFIRKRNENGQPITLELGCGDRKRHTDAIGIDALDYEGVDIVGDLQDVLKRFPDKCTSGVFSYHCFEHLMNLGNIMDQLARIMKSGAKLEVVVPHFSNPYFYSDATHRQPFGLYTFSYFAREFIFSRKCPDYKNTICFEIKKTKLIFKSPRPFYGRWALKRIIQAIVNVSSYSMEFYEENLCWLIPCYEIHFELERL
ncbi:class I SAM-dependent methyltransferase [Desulfatitalea alkaliphila]|uniref:Class I SAM-dependent methyltransferase n=1 Tax=Desulfatitalea alkaliphila TaxID=2929485 RepID=A0AA41R753_9BACT|nr:class I SAM-dependent methyltransferase [Desulfatitalea alkaliphila]MCJ8502480.1 class I SAM-dependent methyltransferase [Desulfatitalea alkaliphila]